MSQTNISLQDAHIETREAWNANAAHWDNHMGDMGNDFVNELIWPALTRLLNIQAGQRILDIGCGNGLYARRLAEMGAKVTAFDFAAEMVALARKRAADLSDSIDYHVLDATDEMALLALDEGQFDSAMCNMAIMDISDIDPLMRAMSKLLVPGGHFVFAVCHPCFNQTGAMPMSEMEDTGYEVKVTYGVKVTRYMTPTPGRGTAIAGQPKPQFYFDRPLHQLLGAAFAAGFVVDGLEERAFPPENEPNRNPLGWSGRFSEIPAALVVRVKSAQ